MGNPVPSFSLKYTIAFNAAVNLTAAGIVAIDTLFSGKAPKLAELAQWVVRGRRPEALSVKSRESLVSAI
jgi:hypothetical protein